MSNRPAAVEFVTDEISLSVTANRPVVIKHGLGRQVTGWSLLWKDAPCDLYLQTPQSDTSQRLILIPTGTANIRIALL